MTFGPRPRSFAKRINRKVRILGIRRAFTERLDEGAVIVVEDISPEQPKTKAVADVLKAVGVRDGDALVIVDGIEKNLSLATRNMPKVVVLKATAVNPYWILCSKKIVVTRAGLEMLGSYLAPREKKS